ncbi:LPS-assembly protein LptD [Sulfurirhabdus autotrophica]|uniref:LPS-assembly protein LptD n=1 Tax=Sulfurirhabdus autotrophica TaxID=1706046 RepID=A0A4R3XZ96_9PROT|nr:LPS-assembly protein LptD [Sulfurirhabdus autotrophica]TCV84696.1 LPS-assembly protein [Sulfurirhabdus autotrophica]
MQTIRLSPIALALLYLYPTSALSATNLPLLKVDPALLQAAEPTVQTKKTPDPSSPPKQPVSAKPINTENSGTAATVPPAKSVQTDSGVGQPPKTTSPTLDPANAPIILSADQIKGHQDQEVEAFGKVEMQKYDKTLFAEHLTYSQPTDELFAEKNVRIEQKGNIITGPELKLKLDTNVGYMEKPAYELAGTHARGTGERLEFQGEDKFQIKDASYTTCPVGQDDWFIHAGNLDLDRTSQIGTAHHAYIEFKGVPILYTPWLEFPLNNQRKSGLLTPSFGSSGNSGLEITTPYYWNIAPNYDLTLSPRLLSKRGLQIGSDFRYLQPTYAGSAQFEYLPNDRVANINRYALNLQHAQRFDYNWSGSLNIQKVSDDNYFRDLSTRLTNTTQTNLPREGVLSYNGGGWWGFSARVQRFQTLQDPLAPIVQPYHRTPQLTLTALKQDIYGTDIGLTSEFVNFNNPAPTALQPDGKRFTIYPSISLPLNNSFAYITPKIGVHYTHYTLDKNQTSFPDSTRTVPIISVDSGMVFERDANFLDKAYLQTLEPRLYYLRVPYRDQSQIPNFDSGIADFNFAQIFSENQFTGGDRISDANQLTTALTTRLIEPETGFERVRAAIGQRFYFNEQQVTLNAPARNTKTSDFLAALSAQISSAWSLDAGWQYNPNQHLTQKSSFSTRYRPEPGKVINMSYRFTRDSLKQIDLSTQWPLSGNISGLARLNYSLLDSTIVEGLAGIEYSAGCWAFRVVAHRIATATAQSSNSIFLQLELNGVSRLGSNPLDTLKQNISGYTKTNE